MHVFAAIDIGTNSIRLAVVQAEPDARMTVLAVHREMVRLGEDLFEEHQMTPAAIERGVLVCSKFAEVARGFGVQEIITFATAAVREAENREEFIERVRKEAEIEVRVISGPEEARLIWLGVSSGIELGDRQAALIDIGGGSTEVIVGGTAGHRMLESLKLGSIRLSQKFFHHDGPITPETFQKVQNYVQGVAVQAIHNVRRLGFDMLIGSAGTVSTLADIIARRLGDPPINAGRGYSFKLQDLREAIYALCRLPLAERRKVPGMDPNRADIILGGAAVLLTLMESLGAEKMTVSDRGLRDGILLDHLLRTDEATQEFRSFSVRRRSILQLARACRYEPDHAEHTSRLALRLFDELYRLEQHHYGVTERELLEYAGLTHDIGAFLSHSNHQKHAYYLIRNSDLLGFNDTEIEIIANVALYHRKGIPRKRHPNMTGLTRSERRRVSVLSAILRVAEGLDRGHLGVVRDLHVTLTENPRKFTILLDSDADCQLELWGLQNNRDLFEHVFEGQLTAHVVNEVTAVG